MWKHAMVTFIFSAYSYEIYIAVVVLGRRINCI